MASTPPPGPHSTAPVSATRRSEILHELVQVASNETNAQLDDLTTRLSDALAQTVRRTTDPREQRRRSEAASLLRKNRYPFFYVASSRLSTALLHATMALDDPSFKADDDHAPPALPPDLEMDKKLCLIKVGRAIEQRHVERLMALNIRLAHLLGREELETAHNPFRPQVFLATVHEAWCEFQPDATTHHLIYPLLQPDLCLDMGPILHALNNTLIKRGILPQLNVSEHLRQAALKLDSQPAEESEIDPLMRQLRRLFPAEPEPDSQDVPAVVPGGFPSLFQDEVVQATAARNALLSHLEGVRRHKVEYVDKESGQPRAALLIHVRNSAPAGSLLQSDGDVITLLIQIFEAVFRDKNIPVEIRTLIGSLQLPVLKTALTDKNFFFNERHPSRRAVELMASLGVGWDRRKGQDPLYVLIDRCVKRIQQESEHRPAVFAEVVHELEAFIKREETAVDQALSAPIAKTLQQEKTQRARKSAREAVELRVGTGEVVAFVETFLEDKWVSVLTLAYSVQDDKPQVVESALRTMDELVWSVKPKITSAERKELLAKLPALVAMLNKWLDLIKWKDSDRIRFFDELSACHASIIRAPVDLSPQRQLELSIEAAQKAAERRLERQARQRPEPVPDAFDDKVRQLQRGTWIEFVQADGTKQKLTLAWITPMRSLYLFTTRERQEAFTMSAEELARALREQKAQVLTVPGLIGRALADALGVESANSGMSGGKTAA